MMWDVECLFNFMIHWHCDEWNAIFHNYPKNQENALSMLTPRNWYLS